MKSYIVRRSLTALVCAATSLAVSSSFAVGTRRFELKEGKDFRGGELQGVAIDSTGQVRPGLDLGKVPVADADAIWATLQRSDGSVLLATGNEGKLLQVKDGTVRTVAETDDLIAATLVEAWKGTVLVGTLPSGKILQWRNGKLQPFAQLEGAEHIWKLAFDSSAGVAYAATGPSGKLFRIDSKGKAEVYFQAEEDNLVSLALTRRRGKVTVFTGTGSRAKLYSVSGPGRATVLYDFDRTEVRDIVAGENGELFAIANEIRGSRTPTSGSKGSDTKGQAKTTGKGVLYRFSASGVPEKLLENKSEHFISLSIDDNGQPVVGTGVEGRVYTVDSMHNEVLLADTDERQVGGVSLVGTQQYVATSDPAVLHPVRRSRDNHAVWVSRPLDAGLRAHFGRLQWSASGPLKVSTRTGNTKTPDDTWSPWTTSTPRPQRVKSPAARYIQIRAQWEAESTAVLSDVSLPFVTDNLRAVITSIDVDGQSDTGVSNGDDGLIASGGPIVDEADAMVGLKWKMDNPDEDQLRYRLSYRMVGQSQWTAILPPQEKLTKNQYEWNTADLPEGKYRVRVEASDELSNPPSLVTRHERLSPLVVVDNTPPTVTGLSSKGTRVVGTAVDGVGPITRIEMSVAGSREWTPFFPQDGIFDQQRESFDVDLDGLIPAGGALVSLRIYDRANNFVVQHVTIR